MTWNVEQAANDLERYVLRGEKPAVDACKVLIELARKRIPTVLACRFKVGDFIERKEPDELFRRYEIVRETNCYMTLKQVAGKNERMFGIVMNRRKDVLERDWKKVVE